MLSKSNDRSKIVLAYRNGIWFRSVTIVLFTSASIPDACDKPIEKGAAMATQDPDRLMDKADKL